MAETDIQRYLDRVESQHKTKPRFMAHLTTLLEMVDGGHCVAKDIPSAFHVQEAIGNQLDVNGELVGVDRRFPPVSIPGLPALLSDETFRQVILSKIIRNQWDGTESAFHEIWDATLASQMDARYYDNQDMTVSVDIIGQIEPVMVELILAGYIIPKPMGVGMNVNIVVETAAKCSLAGSVATLDAAQIYCPLDYRPVRNIADTVMATPVLCASSGFAVCEMAYPTYSATSTDEKVRILATTDSGHISCSMDYCRYSSIDELSYSGISSFANSARVKITTQ